MSNTSAFLKSSVGRKLLMALTGFFLFSFLVVHLTVNLFLLRPDEGKEFNTYAEFMATHPLLRPLEIVLFGGFLLHAAVGVWLWLENRRVRPAAYKLHRASATSTLTSRIMFWTGLAVALFLMLHVNAFFVSTRFLGDEREMSKIVRDAFQSPLTVGFYLVALVFLGYHLRHGFQSAAQTLGLRVGAYQKLIDAAGVIFWLIIPLSFAALPLYFFWAH
ncbi:MAG: succinate dehydrogenase cytochrome b subunit [Bacteroidota bacterium]